MFHGIDRLLDQQNCNVSILKTMYVKWFNTLYVYISATCKCSRPNHYGISTTDSKQRGTKWSIFQIKRIHAGSLFMSLCIAFYDGKNHFSNLITRFRKLSPAFNLKFLNVYMFHIPFSNSVTWILPELPARKLPFLNRRSQKVRVSLWYLLLVLINWR